MLRLTLKGEAMELDRGFLKELDLFKGHPELLHGGEYAIQSDVRRDVLELFVSRVAGGPGDVTKENAEQLWALSDEFGFSGLDGEIMDALRDGMRAC